LFKLQHKPALKRLASAVQLPWVELERDCRAGRNRCNCWKHLRYYKGGKVVYKTTKQRTWAGAEREKQTKLQAMDKEVRGAPPPSPQASIAEAVELYIADKKQQGVRHLVKVWCL
jgi:hypothetical protein